MISLEWQLMFDKAGVVHLTATRSDHVPIMLHFTLEHFKAPRPFRFMEAWTRDPSCELVINTTWDEDIRNGRRYSLTSKIQCTAKALTKWNREGSDKVE